MPRAVAVWVLAFVAFQALYTFCVGLRLVDVLILFALHAVAARVAWRTFQSGTWRGLWQSLGLVAVEFGAFSFGQQYDLTGRYWPIALAVVTSLGGVCVVLVLGGLRLVRPARALLLTFALVVGVGAVEIGRRAWRIVPPLPQVLQPNTQAESGEQAPLNAAERRPVEWIGGMSIRDEEIGHLNRPLAIAKTYYPTNPRGYFREERPSARLDARLFVVNLQAGTDASLEVATTRRGPMRFSVQPRPERPEPWHAVLSQSLTPLEGGRHYRLRFRAQADAARGLRIHLTDTVGTWQDVAGSQDVQLATTWSDLVVDFETQKEAAKPIVQVMCGESGIPFELSDLYFDRRDATGAQLDASQFRLSAQQGAQATLSADSPAFEARVEGIMSPARVAWHVQLEQRGLAVDNAQRYVVMLDAKADAARRMQVAVGQAHDPWQSLGLAQTVELTTEWQTLQLEFLANADEAQARLQFDLGGDEAAVNLRNVSLLPIDRVSPPEAQYYVEYHINSHGMRDEEIPLEKPPGTFRIACLGDSFTFGQGVHADDLYTGRLEALLNEDPPAALRYETLNFGVCGFSTRQERQWFERLGAQFAPDLVVVAMVENDDMSTEEEEAAGLYEQPGKDGLIIAELINQRRAERQRDFTKCLPELAQLRADCVQLGSQFVIAVFRTRSTEEENRLLAMVEQEFGSKGVPVVDLGETLVTPDGPHDLIVHRTDWHPNEVAHRLVANHLARFLRDRRLLSPRVRRQPPPPPSSTSVTPSPSPATPPAAPPAAGNPSQANQSAPAVAPAEPAPATADSPSASAGPTAAAADAPSGAP